VISGSCAGRAGSADREARSAGRGAAGQDCGVGGPPGAELVELEPSAVVRLARRSPIATGATVVGAGARRSTRAQGQQASAVAAGKGERNTRVFSGALSTRGMRPTTAAPAAWRADSASSHRGAEDRAARHRVSTPPRRLCLWANHLRDVARRGPARDVWAAIDGVDRAPDRGLPKQPARRRQPVERRSRGAHLARRAQPGRGARQRRTRGAGSRMRAFT
jgi:hypothetical protein